VFSEFGEGHYCKVVGEPPAYGDGTPGNSRRPVHSNSHFLEKALEMNGSGFIAKIVNSANNDSITSVCIDGQGYCSLIPITGLEKSPGAALTHVISQLILMVFARTVYVKKDNAMAG
jgi:hypothetical protein